MNEIILNVKLFYKKIDFINNEGFYPIIHETHSINYDYFMIQFELKYYNDTYYWCQLNGNVIMGFDDDNGLILLKSLNKFIKNMNKESFYILNCGGRIVFPVTYNSTYRVLQER